MSVIHPVQGSTQSVFGSNLTILASVAAIELDNLSLGRPTTIGAVPKLAEILMEAIPDQERAGGVRHLLDPVKADVFSQALRSAGLAQITSISEISSQTRAMADKLASLNDVSDVGVLRTLRDFCVALSQSAQAESESRYEDRMISPYRR